MIQNVRMAYRLHHEKAYQWPAWAMYLCDVRVGETKRTRSNNTLEKWLKSETYWIILTEAELSTKEERTEDNANDTLNIFRNESQSEKKDCANFSYTSSQTLLHSAMVSILSIKSQCKSIIRIFFPSSFQWYY